MTDRTANLSTRIVKRQGRSSNWWRRSRTRIIRAYSMSRVAQRAVGSSTSQAFTSCATIVITSGAFTVSTLFLRALLLIRLSHNLPGAWRRTKRNARTARGNMGCCARSGGTTSGLQANMICSFLKYKREGLVLSLERLGVA